MGLAGSALLRAWRCQSCGSSQKQQQQRLSREPLAAGPGFSLVYQSAFYIGEKKAGLFSSALPAQTRRREREILLVMSWAQKERGKKAVIEDFPLVMESLKTTHDSWAGRDLLQPKQS